MWAHNLFRAITTYGWAAVISPNRVGAPQFCTVPTHDHLTYGQLWPSTLSAWPFCRHLYWGSSLIISYKVPWTRTVVDSYPFASSSWIENRLVHLKTKQERMTMLLRPLPSFPLEHNFTSPALSFFQGAWGLNLLSFQLFSSLYPLHPLELFTPTPGVLFPPVPGFLAALKNKHLGPFCF